MKSRNNLSKPFRRFKTTVKVNVSNSISFINLWIEKVVGKVQSWTKIPTIQTVNKQFFRFANIFGGPNFVYEEDPSGLSGELREGGKWGRRRWLLGNFLSLIRLALCIRHLFKADFWKSKDGPHYFEQTVLLAFIPCFVFHYLVCFTYWFKPKAGPAIFNQTYKLDRRFADQFCNGVGALDHFPRVKKSLLSMTAGNIIGLSGGSILFLLYSVNYPTSILFLQHVWCDQPCSFRPATVGYMVADFFLYFYFVAHVASAATTIILPLYNLVSIIKIWSTIKGRDEERERIHRQLILLIQHVNDFFNPILLTFLPPVIMVGVVFSNVSFIHHKSPMELRVLIKTMIQGVNSAGITFHTFLVFRSTEGLFESSSTFLDEVKRRMSIMPSDYRAKLLLARVRSHRALRLNVSMFYYIEKGYALQFLQDVLDNTVGYLLTIPN